MRGRWAQIRGTIVESPDAPPGATGPTFGLSRENHTYVVEVTGPGGQVLRGTVDMLGRFIHAVGEPMAVEVNFKTGEMKLDGPRMGEILSAQAESCRTAAQFGLHEVAGDAAAAQAGFGAPSPPPAPPAPAHRPSGHAASPEQRLTALKNLHGKGLLTEAEYEAKRAEIISGL
jgi:hypothetical protein